MITATQVADRVRLIGEYEPDTVYFDMHQKHYGGGSVECLYSLGDGPGCIVGKALYELGVSIETLRDLDAQDGGTKAIEIPGTIIERDSDEAMQYIQDVQYSQDSGSTWGEAISL